MRKNDSPPSILWFRDDLRLADNPALQAALEDGPVLAVYVLDEKTGGVRPLGGAARWWLHGALDALRGQIEKEGGQLLTFEGEAPEIVSRLAGQSGARSVHCQHRYQKEAIAQDDAVARALEKTGATLVRHHGYLLRVPDAVTTKSGTPYKVFTPYWRAACDLGAPPRPLPRPKEMPFFTPGEAVTEGLPALNEKALLPHSPDWAGGLRAEWEPGEDAGQALLADFARHDVAGYEENRNLMGVEGTSRLSPYLRFGHVSPRQLWAATASHHGKGATAYQRELGWRDFCWQTLHHFPQMIETPLNEDFSRLPWRQDQKGLHAWQKGRTGIPVVDAGMRQLWQTGWMHNRARMIVGSFLVKHLLVNWRDGEEWFWDTLVDADAASNAANWQWVAGCGTDAAPFFRIFNPVRQMERFDPEGAYVRQWVPELSKLDDKAIRAPWTTEPMLLRSADIALGRTYPEPIVDLDEGRDRATAAWEKIR